MYDYQIRPLYGTRAGKLAISFITHESLAALSAALREVFEPLGYVFASYDHDAFRLAPGSSAPHGSEVTIETDEWDIVWVEAAWYGADDVNRRLIGEIDELLRGSGAFRLIRTLEGNVDGQ